MLGLREACLAVVCWLGIGVRGSDVWYKLRDGVRVLSSDESSSEERAAVSVRHCANLCTGHTECRAANYNNGVCELIMADLLEQTEDRPANIGIVNTHCLPNPCQNSGICTFDDAGVNSCICVGGFRGTNCEGDKLSIRVDDEATVYSKGAVLHDTFAITGSQHSITYTVTLNTDVLVLKRYNPSGPGGQTVSVNGATVTGWRCVTFGADQDPETVYPGSTYPDYDDSAWTDAISADVGCQLCRAKLTM